jgi:hypothetical protein
MLTLKHVFIIHSSKVRFSIDKQRVNLSHKIGADGPSTGRSKKSQSVFARKLMVGTVTRHGIFCYNYGPVTTMHHEGRGG